MDLKIGEVVELLIGIKDGCRDRLTRREIDALNDACNILDHAFPAMETKSGVVDDVVCRTALTRDNVKSALSWRKYVPSDANVDKVAATPYLDDAVFSACERALQEVIGEANGLVAMACDVA